ncbi:hypothetical protein [Pseudomonas sp. W4I3]|uniref:YVTN family beta-propeller repeat protein n=1 Tax=Pseudomonas sp. W4I3 TaxID=3042294 RepID=UPI00277E50C2|nr:hypothetical protein [Pseudomonas sp. W4I3]MDQ0742212.1 YVTN family beta-propeller protein [Pseudomonas sp. W4I3]
MNDNQNSYADIPVKNGSRYVVITPNGKEAYVSNWSHSSVTLIDVATDTVTQVIDVGKLAGFMAVSPDGKYVIVVTGGSSEVSIIDALTKKVTLVPVDMIGFQAAISPDGKKAYITGERLVVIDIAAAKVIDRFQFEHGVAGIAITQDGTHAWLTMSLGNSVSYVELANFNIIESVPVSAYPYGLAMSEDGRRIVVGAFIHSTLSVIDTTTRKVEKEIKVNSQPYGIAFSKDGGRVYACVFPDSGVEVVDMKSLERIGSISAGRNPMGIAVVDETRAYVTNSHESETKLSVISLS